MSSGTEGRLNDSLTFRSDLQQTGLAFLGIGAGQVIAVACQPYFNR